MQNGDGIVVFLILLVLGTWLFIYVRTRLKETVQQGIHPLPEYTEVPEDDATRLLEAEGYTVTGSKQRVPLHITVDGEAELQSRLFIDYFAERDGLYYAVKLAKERKPLEMTGSAVRDHLLIYQLLYPQTAGVLYLDLQQNKVQCIVFHVDLEHDEDEVS
ncbi:hypothetical protein ACFQ88_29865 [Paenibacillus sp. NPDC056579]|uniref:hypothetical protein n=1 Tax=unclassified Paenibacillus TaxID=185978 RepID=UPI001EF95FAC|nr:hypothetical protein [Paenibacillus sp. H1-7]ULL15461.1 hypothetical protein DVH26_14035 [Paenibacillus sp. H1-7]